MLQNLGDYIANCLVRAAHAEQRAAEASSEDMRIDNERMAKSWRHLARSYQFIESLERFLLDSDKARSARPPEAPIEAEIIPLFPPPGAKFDPEAVAMLSAAFQRAIEGQSPAVYEIIARHIIELASQGERDPDKLCQGALTL